MIPKTIHYCWFGGGLKPKLAKKCINSWRKYCTDYEFIEWNEENFDISSAPLYVRQAYAAKKWAYVTDYVRLKVIYDNGGIYLDTDVQIIKPLDNLLDNCAFFGFEEREYVATGLGFGAEKNTFILNELMSQYHNIQFVNEDGKYDQLTCPMRNTEVFKNHGLIQNGETQRLDNKIVVFSSEYFCPISYSSMKKIITPNTYSIHWFAGSWFDNETKEKERLRRKKANQKNKKEKRKDIFIHLPNIISKKILGEEKYELLKSKLKK